MIKKLDYYNKDKNTNCGGNPYERWITLQNMGELEFYMDVSPEWWTESRKNESSVKKYICKKFEYDFYPRNISDDAKSALLDKLKDGRFVYEFLPEDESIRENYSIWNGKISNQPTKKLTNSRLLINF
ncbi:MAG: hypothetical protein ACW9XB_05785 [Candidatus Nitrosopumilus sp. metabat.KBP569_Feb_25m_nospike.7]